MVAHTTTIHEHTFSNKSQHAGWHLLVKVNQLNIKHQWPLLVAPRPKVSFLTRSSECAVHLPWHGVSVVPQLDWTAKVAELNQARWCQKDVGSWWGRNKTKSESLAGKSMLNLLTISCRKLWERARGADLWCHGGQCRVRGGRWWL